MDLQIRRRTNGSADEGSDRNSKNSHLAGASLAKADWREPAARDRFDSIWIGWKLSNILREARCHFGPTLRDRIMSLRRSMVLAIPSFVRNFAPRQITPTMKIPILRLCLAGALFSSVHATERLDGLWKSRDRSKIRRACR